MRGLHRDLLDPLSVRLIEDDLAKHILGYELWMDSEEFDVDVHDDKVYVWLVYSP